MRIFSQTAKKKLRVLVFTGPDGRKMIHVPDQGIKIGCDQLSKLGEGPMDHSDSKDWQEEVRNKGVPLPQKNTPVPVEEGLDFSQEQLNQSNIPGA